MSTTLTAPEIAPAPILEVDARSHLRRNDNPAWDPDLYTAHRTPEGWLFTNSVVAVQPGTTWLVTDDKTILRLADYTDAKQLFMWDDFDIYAY